MNIKNQIISNYHTHIYLCRHATGTISDYVSKAYELNYHTIGISDHGPFPDWLKEKLHSRRMTEDEFINTYLKDLQTITEEFDGKIKVLKGMEIEYLPETKELIPFYKSKLDYLILGQHYYVKKVCVIGTESCGKSTLVRNLAMYFNTSHVEEAGRYICDLAGGIDNMQKYHYFEILFKHKQLEKEALTGARKVLLVDTDSIITLYYYNLGFNDNDPLNQAFSDVAEGISILNNYDLYLFLEPDVEWVQDGTRTYGEQEVREQNNLDLKALLKKNGIEYVTIRGNYQQRYEQSKEKILELMRGV